MWNGRGAEIDENKRAELHVQSCIPRILCGASLAHLAHSFYWETCYHRGICKFGEFRWYQGSALVHCRSVTNCVQLFVTPCVATHQAFLFFIISRVCSYSCPLSWWCYLTISSSAALFFCLQSFPASVFSNESTFHIRWPKYWSFSFSISPSIEYSGLISFKTDGLISLLSLLKMNDTLKKNWDGRNHDIVAPFVCCKWLEDKDYIYKEKMALDIVFQAWVS